MVPVFGSSTKALIRLRLRFMSSPASAILAARGLGALSPGAARLFPRGEWLRQPEAWAHFPRMRRAFYLCGPSARHRSGLRKSFYRNQGLFAVWDRVASLGCLPLSPPPCLLPPAGMAGSSLEFLSPFVLRTAGGVFRPVNFSLLSHSLKKSPSDCSQGLLAGPYPKQCRRLLSVSPPLAGGGCGRLGYLSAGSCF